MGQSRESKRHRSGVAAAVVGGALFLGRPATAATDAHWLNTVSGDWTNPAQWSTSPAYPNNGIPAGSTYNALLDATGTTGYTVTLNASASVTSVTLSSPAVFFTLLGTLTADTLSLQSGRLTLNGTLANATVTGTNSAFIAGNAGTLSSVTIGGSASDPPVVLAGSVTAAGGMNFASGGSLRLDSQRTGSASLRLGGPLSGNGSLLLNNFNGSAIIVAPTSGTAFSVGSGVSIITAATAPNGTTDAAIGSASSDFTNAGLISAQTPSVFAYISGQNVINTGTMQAINGGVLTIIGNLTNTGSLIENNAELNLNLTNFIGSPQARWRAGSVS
jgi:hypothetical protein